MAAYKCLRKVLSPGQVFQEKIEEAVICNLPKYQKGETIMKKLYKIELSEFELNFVLSALDDAANHFEDNSYNELSKDIITQKENQDNE